MKRLGATLTKLAEIGLLRRVLSETEFAYKFRHTLDQQTAYHSLLRKDREEIHKVIGLVIERVTPDEVETLAPVLADHFSVGGDDQAAYEALDHGEDEAEVLSSRRILWVLLAERALWLEEDGQPEAAASERDRARPALDYVADHIQDDFLRQSFLNSAWLRQVGIA